MGLDILSVVRDSRWPEKMRNFVPRSLRLLLMLALRSCLPSVRRRKNVRLEPPWLSAPSSLNLPQNYCPKKTGPMLLLLTSLSGPSELDSLPPPRWHRRPTSLFVIG